MSQFSGTKVEFVILCRNMSQMARVFSKLVNPYEARVESLGRQNTSGVPFNIAVLMPEVVAVILYIK